MIMFLPSVFLAVLLSRWIGIPGLPLATVLCTLPGAIFLPWLTRRALRLHLLRV